ncbi:hypothetical protein ACSPAH_02980 [Buttiauxella agrestis]
MSQTSDPIISQPALPDESEAKKFTLSENITALVQIKNDNIARLAQGKLISPPHWLSKNGITAIKFILFV